VAGIFRFTGENVMPDFLPTGAKLDALIIITMFSLLWIPQLPATLRVLKYFWKGDEK
jgi:hypothetical protein